MGLTYKQVEFLLTSAEDIQRELSTPKTTEDVQATIANMQSMGVIVKQAPPKETEEVQTNG
jgi:hypothetical protein